MLTKLILGCLRHRAMVLVLALLAAFFGWQAMKATPLDAIPDLSDVQVIVKTRYPGQAPQLVEEQITYPLSTALMSVPGARTVRGFSFFGDSYVYVLFDDKTDPYWARSRVLEYLNQAKAQLPAGVEPAIGPDASGVGWVYEYALVDKTGQHDLAQLKTLQDWFLKLELQGLPGVSEVATVGGLEKSYQVVADPVRLAGLGLRLSDLEQAIVRANRDVGGAVIEMAEAEYMVRMHGYKRSLEELRALPLDLRSSSGIALTLGDVARVRLGPVMRRGIAELDGQGEVVGGIILMRSGENALATIAAVKTKLDELKQGLPQGVEIVTTYDRSNLINSAVDNLKHKLLEEMLAVALVCLLFLLHARSTLVAVISLPLAILLSFIGMQLLGVTANIMSLGGIAIAIGALVDGAIVMVENAHKHLEAWQHEHGQAATAKDHWRLISQAATEVGPALFFSLLIITLSFVPVFSLEAQEGRLFGPLALTKTFAMAAAALLSVTLVPVLMGYFIRGKLRPESANPLSRLLIALYQPLLNLVLKWPKLTLVAALLVTLSAWYPWQHLGSEFMPDMAEGDLLYMPTTLPGISVGKAQQLLQQTDRLIKTVPEVQRVFGKAGRAETATDPAPLTMLETTITLKPKDQWRPGLTLDQLIEELDQRVKVPGLTNAWVQPIKTRIDMLSTGIKTPVGIKIAGPDQAQLQAIGTQVEAALGKLPQTRSVFAERPAAGRYIDITPKLAVAARYGLTQDDIAQVVKYGIGGAQLDQVVEGDERYQLTLRYPRAWRDHVSRLAGLPLVGRDGRKVTLGEVADIQVVAGPPMLKSENGRLTGWVFVDIKGTSVGDYIQLARGQLATITLPPRYSLSFAGQYEYLERAKTKLTEVTPVVLGVILVLLYMTFGRLDQSLWVLLSLPMALSGSIWMLYWLDYNLSVAVAVGMIALAGVAAEFGVVMLLYINNALKALPAGADLTAQRRAIMSGAVQRIRPKAMTVVTILASLVPILLTQGTGSEVMTRIAAPMLGGMITAPLLSLFVLPAMTWLAQRASR
ncbi:efflux RND transporter permease subunit [Gallaecimonas xiamenensis]|uniref:CzcA family heavy metal efflux protein n=1 Tax=Gallaecimonas xiamenensis 3-C-1 TaxID=745411 RepID=K2ITY9_9GAMM|nr:CusA/CzcA family heavy metal efflux RND transporter [Gallaecimonas xiamenensis]EKE73696.1 CzcA family heavy metal efflux protein [Gallaecimonas xiamenensis 3-C-1]